MTEKKRTSKMFEKRLESQTELNQLRFIQIKKQYTSDSFKQPKKTPTKVEKQENNIEMYFKSSKQDSTDMSFKLKQSSKSEFNYE